MMMPMLILTAGLPRSGKSTWAKRQGMPVVNPDSIRLALHGKPYEPLAEPMVWAIARVMVRALFLAGHTHVILDATTTTKRRVQEWKSDQWETHVEWFVTSENTCIERAIANDQEYLVPVIQRMRKQWDHPVALTPDSA